MSLQTAAATGGIVNSFKWTLVFIFIALGVGGNYYYSDQSVLIRVAAILSLAALATVLALRTAGGKRFWQFATESRNELRKVVWPTRQETLQMTALVIGVVTIISIILWCIDIVLLRIIAWLTGYGAL
jgi:preprotein translocase subunit SecE